MTSITFTIPSVLNGGSGEKKTDIEANTLSDAFVKISETMGDDFKRRVLNGDGTPKSLINIYIKWFARQIYSLSCMRHSLVAKLVSGDWVWLNTIVF